MNRQMNHPLCAGPCVGLLTSSRVMLGWTCEVQAVEMRDPGARLFTWGHPMGWVFKPGSPYSLCHSEG